MRALLPKEYKLLEIAEMPEPAVGPEDVLVRVKACGICGSDVHGYGQPGRKIKGPLLAQPAHPDVAEFHRRFRREPVDGSLLYFDCPTDDTAVVLEH